MYCCHSARLRLRAATRHALSLPCAACHRRAPSRSSPVRAKPWARGPADRGARARPSRRCLRFRRERRHRSRRRSRSEPAAASKSAVSRARSHSGKPACLVQSEVLDLQRTGGRRGNTGVRVVSRPRSTKAHRSSTESVPSTLREYSVGLEIRSTPSRSFSYPRQRWTR
jgi:hypothetical protein